LWYVLLVFSFVAELVKDLSSLILEISANSVGIEGANQVFVSVIPRGSTYPFAKSLQFSNHNSILRVFEGEDKETRFDFFVVVSLIKLGIINNMGYMIFSE
jgi:hypothetical protein